MGTKIQEEAKKLLQKRMLMMGGKAAVAAWSPTTPLSGVSPIVWLQADSLSGSDGDPIAAWNSTTPATLNVAQTNATKKPLYKINILNGRPGVLFDNSNDNLAATLDFSTYDKLTFFAVFSAAAGANAMVAELGAIYYNDGSFGISRSNANKVDFVHADATHYNIYETTTTLTTVPKLVCFGADRTQAGAAEVHGWVNGAANGSEIVATNVNGNYGNLNLNIGSRGEGGSLPLNGYIFEILIYPGVVLSDTDRQKVEGYLNTRWALFSSGVSGYADDAYSITKNRSDGGTYIQTSPAARLVYRTDSETAYLDTYNNIYAAYPDFCDVGVRVNGADKTAAAPGASGTKAITVDLGVGADKIVEFINGLQSGGGIDSVTGTFVCGVTFNKPATQIAPTVSPRIIIYGDSIAVGDECTNPSLQGWAQLVRNAYTGSMLLEARGVRSLWEDASTAGLRTTFAAHLASVTPAIIWMAIGTNDYGLERCSSSDFGVAYADLLDKIHAAIPVAIIYAQTQLVRGSEAEIHSGWGTLGDYRAQIATAQSTRSAYCTLVDGTGETFPQTGDLIDGVHPTTAGHAIYAAAVKTILGVT